MFFVWIGHCLCYIYITTIFSWPFSIHLLGLHILCGPLGLHEFCGLLISLVKIGTLNFGILIDYGKCWYMCRMYVMDYHHKWCI